MSLQKVAQNVAQPIFDKIYTQLFTGDKSCSKSGAT
jgi:hypothetical protein